MPDAASGGASPPLALSALLVAVGGALGALLRSFAPHVEDLSAFPWATLGVNVAGSLALGLLVGRLRAGGGPHWVRPLLGTGLLGGFTTFSAFAVETAERLATEPAVAGAYAVLTVVGAVAAAATGLMVASGTRGSRTSR